MNIYVGNLSYEVDENELRQVIEKFGAIASIKLISDRDTGKSKGFGFIEMDDTDDAYNAIRTLNGQILQGRPMTVKIANPRAY